MAEINTKVQIALDNAITDILGFDPALLSSYSISPHTLSDPSIVADTICLPSKAKGMGLRRMDDYRGYCAYVGGWHMVAQQCIDIKDEEGNIIQNGLYPLLEPLLGPASQDAANEHTKWTKFTDGNSALGNQFKKAVQRLAAMCPADSNGPLAYPTEEIRPISLEGKLQKELTAQVETAKITQINARYNALPADDRRKVAFLHRQPLSMACFTTAPTTQSQVPQNLYTGVAAHILGAIDPIIRPLVGASIGDQQSAKVDLFGDALATAILPGDRWRTAHDTMKSRIFLDLKTLGIFVEQEKYGMFTRFLSARA
jgi:hypothetical protein